MTPEPYRLAGDENSATNQSGTARASKFWQSVVPSGVLIADPLAVELEPDPIRREWILSGAPRATSKILARSRDWLSILVVWECTAGRFNWRYTRDETLIVLAGKATLTGEDGSARRFVAGDVVFFPAGTSYVWHIEDRIRKIAIVRETLWPPFGMALKAWKKVIRTARLAGGGFSRDGI